MYFPYLYFFYISLYCFLSNCHIPNGPEFTTRRSPHPHFCAETSSVVCKTKSMRSSFFSFLRVYVISVQNYLACKMQTAWSASVVINLLATDFFFQILAHSVFKMSVIQKPNKVALWNKRHFEEKKWRLYSMFKIFSTDICWINIKWGI